MRARDIMSRPVKRVTADATVRQAAEFLLRHGISGALVVDEHGRPVGVFTQRDIAAHVQSKLMDLPEVDRGRERVKATGESVPDGFHFETFDTTRVADVMTAGVIAVGPEAPARLLAQLMTKWKVHRIFVEERGDLCGVVTSMDLLRHMAERKVRKAAVS